MTTSTVYMGEDEAAVLVLALLCSGLRATGLGSGLAPGAVAELNTRAACCTEVLLPELHADRALVWVWNSCSRPLVLHASRAARMPGPHASASVAAGSGLVMPRSSLLMCRRIAAGSGRPCWRVALQFCATPPHFNDDGRVSSVHLHSCVHYSAAALSNRIPTMQLVCRPRPFTSFRPQQQQQRRAAVRACAAQKASLHAMNSCGIGRAVLTNHSRHVHAGGQEHLGARTGCQPCSSCSSNPLVARAGAG